MPTTLPSRAEALAAEASLRAHLQPADAGFIRQRLALLKLTTAAPGTEGMSEQQIGAFLAAQIGEYVRLLADYPADIWAASCDAWARRSRWFPRVADLEALLLPRLEQRRRAHRRARRILAAIDAPARRPPDTRTPAQRRAEFEAVLRANGYDPARPLAAQIFQPRKMA